MLADMNACKVQRKNDTNYNTTKIKINNTMRVIFSQSSGFPYEKLDMFWMRFNRVRIDCVCLRQDKASLQRHNKELRVNLKRYLVTVNMTNGQPAQKNERFANRPSSMKIERIEHIPIISKNQLIKKPKRPVTCIEGNLSNAVRQIKISGANTRGVTSSQ